MGQRRPQPESSRNINNSNRAVRPNNGCSTSYRHLMGVCLSTAGKHHVSHLLAHKQVRLYAWSMEQGAIAKTTTADSPQPVLGVLVPRVVVLS
eukprot:6464712-Amphidinium_carterae.1